MKLVIVSGTGTDVGKTWVAAELLRLARAEGLPVAARKPLQSLEPGSGPPDSAVLAAASGERPDAVCPPERTYPVPMAPPMAAERLGRPIPTLASLAACLAVPSGAGLAVVEGAGGVASPLAADGDTADLARLIGADVAVVVTEPALGVISAARLAAGALRPIPVVVHLNRFDPAGELHRLNRDWLAARDGLTVTTSAGELLEAVRP